MAVERFLTGKSETIRKQNLLVDAVKSLQNLNGDVFIRAVNNPAGTTIRLNIAAVLERIMKNSEGGGTGGGYGLRRAFVKEAPGATTTLVCYLDIDESGSSVEINVECTIYGGGNLDEAHPSFTDGTPLWVTYNTIEGEWQNVTRIDGGEECDF